MAADRPSGVGIARLKPSCLERAAFNRTQVAVIASFQAQTGPHFAHDALAAWGLFIETHDQLAQNLFLTFHELWVDGRLPRQRFDKRR